jgi:cysteine synthase A
MSDKWVYEAINKIEADFQRSADTHLFRLMAPGFPDIHLYLKDESTHPTRSLKHRLARSLFLYGLCNGWITEGKTIIEASSGSTAVSEAYFARLLDLPFIAVMPRGTSPKKISKIEFNGGRCHLVDNPGLIHQVSHQLVEETNGHFIDQFTFAERATDWRGNNNIAESIFQQMERESHPIPSWIVMSAGTGGTSATIGRYIRYRRLQSRLCVVDPENSVFYDFYKTGNPELVSTRGSNIEGIGRPRVEPSFLPAVIDEMIRIPDSASIASMLFLEKTLGRRCGGSSGTNFYGTCQVIARMKQVNQSGSIVTLICDSGDPYHDTYYSEKWRLEQGFQTEEYLKQLDYFWRTGIWEPFDA